MEGNLLRAALFIGKYIHLFDEDHLVALRYYGEDAEASFQSTRVSGIPALTDLFRRFPASKHEVTTLDAILDPGGHGQIMVAGSVHFLNQPPRMFSQTFYVRPDVRPGARGDFIISGTMYMVPGPAAGPAAAASTAASTAASAAVAGSAAVPMDISMDISMDEKEASSSVGSAPSQKFGH